MDASQTHRTRLPVAVALLTTFIWGANFVFVKAALDQFDVYAFTAVRYLAMLALGWAVLAARRGRDLAALRTLATRDRRQLVICALLGFTLYIPLSMIGLSYTTAFSSVLFIALAPLFASLLLWLLRIERLGPGHVAGLAIALVGSAIFAGDVFAGGWSLIGLGDMLSVIGAFFYAAYNVANKPLTLRYPALVVTTATLTVGTIPVLVGFAPALFRQDWSAVTNTGWAALAFSAVLPVYVAWTTWAWASVRLGVARTSVFLYFVPLWGAATSWLLLHEQFTVQKVLGAALVIGGLIAARFVTAGRGSAWAARIRPATILSR